MKLLAIIDIPNISPENIEHAQHLLDGDTKHRGYTIEVTGTVEN